MGRDIGIRDLDSLAGALYFVVGRGTEGGSASYQLSIAGVGPRDWGTVGSAAANSGYSIGTVQVDLGQRGTWPLGAIGQRPLATGERTYVDAIVEESSAYAKRHRLPFTVDLAQLRDDLLSHGNGRGNRSSITFIDSDTRDSINAWASSDEGKQWIHRHIDYPQIRNMAATALSVLDRNAHAIPDDRRFEAVSILAKTANQLPSQLPRLERVLRGGGDYDELLEEAKSIQGRVRFYHGPKAALVAQEYERSYGDTGKQQSMGRAHSKVARPDYAPAAEALDPDILAALAAVGQRAHASKHVVDGVVSRLQQNLNELGITDARGQPLVVDGILGGPGSRTREAVAAFRAQIAPPGQLAPVLSPAELVAATEGVLDARQPLRRLHRTLADIAEIVPGDAATPRTTGSTPEFLLPGNAGTPAATGSMQRPPDAPSRESALEPGDQGPAVRSLQAQLRLLNGRDAQGRELELDGRFGPRTREAVEQFQLWTGREPTGIADAGTLDALGEHARHALARQVPGLPPGGHLADSLRQGTPDLADAADLRRPQTADVAQQQAVPLRADIHTGSRPHADDEGPIPGRPYSDVRHPQHALYSSLRSHLPDYVSEARLAQFTAAVHAAGIGPTELKAIDINAERAVFVPRSGSRPAVVDMTSASPPMEETSERNRAPGHQPGAEAALQAHAPMMQR